MDSYRITNKTLANTAVDHTEHTNLKGAQYCTTCGIALTAQQTVETQVCSACRHPVKAEWTYCGFCGATLQDSDIVEHYVAGKIDADTFAAVNTSIAAIAAARAAEAAQ